MTEVFTVENPHNDDVTRSRSKRDYLASRLAESDVELDKLNGKVSKLERFLYEAQEAVEAAEVEKVAREGAVKEAERELEQVETDNPELVAELEGN